MKRTAARLLTILLCTSLLTGCGKEQLLLNATDYELDADTDQTSKGISLGDDSEAFLAAYSEYEILTSVAGNDYHALPVEEIPFSDSIETLLPTFFIDGLPMTMTQICKDNDIAKEDLLSLLSSADYLQNHTVVYYYLIFTWENGVITDVRSEYMDYNEDASYYEELN